MLGEELEKVIKDTISTRTFPFASWKNLYEGNNNIGDEIRYVFDRQKKGNKMGNTLDKPSLLMKRQFVRTTDTNDENINKGDGFAAHDLQDEIADVMQESHAAAPSRSAAAPMTNIIKDLQNFLAIAPY